jgi:hypothetical protein
MDPSRGTIDAAPSWRALEILRRLYTILIYGCRNRPADHLAKTRLKAFLEQHLGDHQLPDGVG